MTRAELIAALEAAPGPSRGRPKSRIDLVALAKDYEIDRRAVRKHAEMAGVSIQAVYYQMDRAGIKRRTGGDATKGVQARENNPNWKNGLTKRKDGYILERENGKQRFQHRLLAREILGRDLLPGECVHHVNGDRSDNRQENLEILPSHSEHMKRHCSSDAMRDRGQKGNRVRWGVALKAGEGKDG